MLALVAAVLSVAGPVFRTSVVDVTPGELLPLGGYTARGEAKMEKGQALYARVLVLEDKGTRVAIVSFEALTIPESLVDSVKARIPKNVKLFLVATHTHSAPDSQMLNERMTFKIPGIAPFNRRWLDWYATKIASGVTNALTAEPRPLDRLAVLQQDVDANRGRREGAFPIKAATWLAMGENPVLTVYSAHATVLDEKNLATNGDWPGAASARMGGLVLPGAIGDVSPLTDAQSPVENLASVVEKLRAAFQTPKVKDSLSGDSPIGFAQAPIALDKATASPAFAKHFEVGPPLDQVLVGKFAPPSAQVTAIRIGPLVLVGVPGEPSSAVGRQIQALGQELGFPHVVTVSHCNGWIGYVLTPEDYDRGGYEAALSFNGRSTSQRVVEAAGKAMTALVQTPRVAESR